MREQAQHKAFALHRRHRRHAHIALSPLVYERKVAILRPPLFIQHEPREHLDTRQKNGINPFGKRFMPFLKKPVHTDTDAHAARLRLEMEITRALREGFAEREIDEALDSRHRGNCTRGSRATRAHRNALQPDLAQHLLHELVKQFRLPSRQVDPPL